jgi:hypothetical protein
MQKKLYIAYGSNMDTEQMEFRCPTAELLGKSEMDGWQLLFKGSYSGAYATVERPRAIRFPSWFGRLPRRRRTARPLRGLPAFLLQENGDGPAER